MQHLPNLRSLVGGCGGGGGGGQRCCGGGVGDVKVEWRGGGVGCMVLVAVWPGVGGGGGGGVSISILSMFCHHGYIYVLFLDFCVIMFMLSLCGTILIV